MHKATIIAQFGNNIVKKVTWVRNRVVRRNSATGETYFHEMLAHEYRVFIGCNVVGITPYPSLTRFFGNKTEALRYAKTTKPSQAVAEEVA